MTFLCKHSIRMLCSYCRAHKHGIPEDALKHVVWISFCEDMARRKGYGEDCSSCGAINEPYMLVNKVWNKISRKDSYLCLRCVERRLDRRLKLGDFLDAPINFGMFNFDCRVWLENLKYSKLSKTI